MYRRPSAWTVLQKSVQKKAWLTICLVRKVSRANTLNKINDSIFEGTLKTELLKLVRPSTWSPFYRGNGCHDGYADHQAEHGIKKVEDPIHPRRHPHHFHQLFHTCLLFLHNPVKNWKTLWKLSYLHFQETNNFYLFNIGGMVKANDNTTKSGRMNPMMNVAGDWM